MIILKKVEIADADILLSYSKKTFYEFFAHLNDPANMEVYSAVAFAPQKIFEDKIAGYLKVNFNNAQTEFKDKNALEIERIYVSGEFHGKHIGKQLLNFAVETAINKHFDYVWLGVWEHNYKAIGFYEHNGFETFSSHEFMLGDDEQTDLLMRKILN